MTVELSGISSKESEDTGTKPEMGVQPASAHNTSTKQTEDVGVQCDRYPCGEGMNESRPDLTTLPQVVLPTTGSRP